MVDLRLKKEEKDNKKEALLLLRELSEKINFFFFDSKLVLEAKPRFEKNLGLASSGTNLFFGPKVFLLTPLQITIEVFHELVHASNKKKGVKDVGTNSYHNKHFLEQCVRRGFFVIKHRNHGWSLLSLSQPRNVVDHNSVKLPDFKINTNTSDFLKKTINEISWEDFYRCKKSFPSNKAYTYKYICSCPAPFNSIRSGRGSDSMNPPKIQCMVCEQMFKPATG